MCQPVASALASATSAVRTAVAGRPVADAASPSALVAAATRAESPDGSSARRTGRRRLWETDPTHLCQLVGTCIDARTARDVARRAGYDDTGMPDYEIHHACVHAARDRRHPLARALLKRLESLHTADVRRFSRLRDDEAIRAAWYVARESGDIAGALWALHTHPGVDEAFLQTVFGEVHMLQHECGFREANHRRRMTKAQARIVALEKSADVERARHERRVARDAVTIATLRDELAALRAERTARDRSRAVAGGDGSERGGRDGSARPPRGTPPPADAAEDDRRHALIESLRARAHEQRTLTETAVAERDAALEDVARLEATLVGVLGETEDRAPGPASLCGRCVLVIGGQAHQCRHYRALVEANEGVFLHHDGGVEDKLARVAELVGRADAVLCPTSRVSHDAMHRAKRLCRSSDKPMVFVRQSSLAAFASGLEQVATAVA